MKHRNLLPRFHITHAIFIGTRERIRKRDLLARLSPLPPCLYSLLPFQPREILIFACLFPRNERVHLCIRVDTFRWFIERFFLLFLFFFFSILPSRICIKLSRTSFAHSRSKERPRNPSVYFGTVLFVKEEATVITNNGSIMGEGSWNLRSGRYCLPLSACVVGPQCILPMHFELGREGDEFDSRVIDTLHLASGSEFRVYYAWKRYRWWIDRRIPSRFWTSRPKFWKISILERIYVVVDL